MEVDAEILAVVILVNIRLWLQHQRGNEGLAAKYQLTENIRAAQITLPYVFVDNLITLVDLVAEQGWGLSVLYDHPYCLDSPFFYFFGYIALLVIRHLILFALPTFIFCLSHTLRKPLIEIKQKLKGRSHKIAEAEFKERKTEFKNVMGKVVTLSASQDAYFDQLKDLW
ncbi:unnamed protein product, partial [Mesorhabditis spiculigera]